MMAFLGLIKFSFFHRAHKNISKSVGIRHRLVLYLIEILNLF